MYLELNHSVYIMHFEGSDKSYLGVSLDMEYTEELHVNLMKDKKHHSKECNKLFRRNGYPIFTVLESDIRERKTANDVLHSYRNRLGYRQDLTGKKGMRISFKKMEIANFNEKLRLAYNK